MGLVLFAAIMLPLQLSAQTNLHFPEIDPVLDAEGKFLSAPLNLAVADSIGLTISSAFDTFGPPDRLLSLRGELDWQDDVVFFYSDYSYLYWYEDRVWQIRYDYRYSGDIEQVRMGMSLDEVTGILGAPHYVGTQSVYYDLEDIGYPRRLRFYFKDDILYDVYIYRSDF